MAKATTFTLPQDPGAEAALLGSMIVDPKCVPDVTKQIDGDAFFCEEHRLIFGAILECQTASSVDGFLVRKELEHRGHLVKIGGESYLQKVLDTVPSSANVSYYLKIVLDYHIRRRSIVAAQRLVANGGDPTRDILDQLREIQADLADIQPHVTRDKAILCLADVAAEMPTWLIDNMIPDNGITGLIGDPGASKSYLSHVMAACISTGSPLPGTSLRPKRGTVLIHSCEDSPGIIRARIDRNGGNCADIFIVSEVFDIHHRMRSLDEFLDEHSDCRAIIFDAMPSYIGDTNANSNSEVRAALGPLAALAIKRRVAIIAINHLNKRQDLSFIHRGLGSTAFTALARAVWGVIADKDDPDVRILAPIKCNYAVRPTGLKYRITDGAIVFEPEPWTGRIDDEAKPRDGKLKVDECAGWLKDRLAGGSVLSTTVFTEAVEQGFNRDLCYRAKERLGLHASKAGFDGGKWYWQLQDDGDGEESKNGI